MYIQLSRTVNENLTTVHRILRTEITADRVYVTWMSFDNISSITPLAVETTEVPIGKITGDDIENSLYAWLASSLGPLKDGLIIVETTAIDNVRANVSRGILTLRNSNISGGCMTTLGQIDTDEESLRNILGACQVAALSKMGNRTFSIGWKFHDNIIRQIDADQMIILGTTSMAHISACYNVSWQLKDAVKAANTEDGVIAIDIISPWNSIPTSPHYIAPPTS